MKKLAINKKNIAVIISGLNNGGVERFLINYLDGPILDIYNFFIIYQHDADKHIKNILEKRGIVCYNIPSKEKHLIKHMKEMYSIFKKNKISIIHSHLTTMNFIPFIVGILCKVKKRISHSHNADIEYSKAIYKKIEFVFILLTNLTLTKRVACGKAAGKYLYKNKSFIVLNNAVEIEKYLFDNKSREMIRKELGIDDKSIILGNVGRFNYQKNHIFFLNLMKQLDSKYKLILIGEGPLKQTIEDKARELKIEDRIFFVGTTDDMQSYYSSFDLFLLPSHWEGLPFVLIEAQICGLKCLCSRNVDYESNLGGIIFLDIDNIEEWISYIEKCVLKYSRKIDENVFAKYDLKQRRNDLIKLYDT